MSTQNIRPYNLKGGTGGVIKEISPFLGVASGGKPFSDLMRDRNSSSAPGASGVILTCSAGVKIAIFAGVDESQPPKVDQIFLKNFCQNFETFSPKNWYPLKPGSRGII